MFLGRVLLSTKLSPEQYFGFLGRPFLELATIAGHNMDYADITGAGSIVGMWLNRLEFS